MELFVGKREQPVLIAVEVKGLLGKGAAPDGALLRGCLRGAELLRVEERPVVADGRLQVAWGPHAVLGLGQVVSGVVAGRPVGPDTVDVGEVVHGDHHVGDRHLVEPPVELPLQLGIGEHDLGVVGQRRDVHDDDPVPAVGLAGRTAGISVGWYPRMYGATAR